MRHDGVISIDNADYLARPLRLTPTEASAVIVALRALRAGATAATLEVVDRTLRKLEQAAAAAGPPVEVADDAAGAELSALAERLERAVGEGRQVRLEYWVPARDEISRRTVDPWALTEHDGSRYLEAWCHSAEAPRLFRLDRIAEAAVLDTAVVARTERPRDLAEGHFTTGVPRVTLRLEPPAQWVTEYYPVEAVRAVPGGGALDADLAVADERWLARLLLRLAPHARVVLDPAGPSDEPTLAGAVREAVARESAAALALYGE